jgi:SAM-dependent methyltransferase
MQQMSLFAAPTAPTGSLFRDSAFGDNKQVPVHRWVPWIAGYSAAFVDDVITAYVPPRKTAVILDPFCGVGTTLLQATLRGHHAVGFDLNPYPVLAARAKLSALTIDLSAFDATLDAIQGQATIWQTAGRMPETTPPPLKSRLPFFSPQVEKQVLHALDFINAIASEPIARLYRAAFGAVMVSISNYSYEPSLGSRPGAGKPLITDADVWHVLQTKLQSIRADIAWLQETMRFRTCGAGEVINADFFSAHSQLATGSVELMITSPPYLNNYHYVRNTRPQLYWLQFIASPGEQKPLEIHNFGQYWQTVREAAPIALTFEHAELTQILEQLRATRTSQGAYGGPGWANYVTTYFNDCHRFITVLKRILKRRGVGVVVLGNSIIQGIAMPTERVLGEIAVMHGLQLEGVHCLRAKRVGASITRSSVRQGERSTATLAEFAVIIRKR